MSPLFHMWDAKKTAAAAVWGAFTRVFAAERRCAACSSAFFPLSEKNTASSDEGVFPAEARRHFCPACAARLRPRELGYCPLCGEPAAWQAQPLAPCGRCLSKKPVWSETVFYATHQDLLRDLLLRLKFQNELALSYALGSLLAAHPRLRNLEFDLVAPVPLHGERLAQRGFNQSLELARPVAGRLGLPLDAASLSRVRATDPQRGLSRDDRRKNIQSAFAAGPKVRARRVLLVDDTMTTGATLEAAASALLEAGAALVHVAVVSRTPALA